MVPRKRNSLFHVVVSATIVDTGKVLDFDILKLIFFIFPAVFGKDLYEAIKEF